MNRTIVAALVGGTLALTNLSVAQAQPERVVVTHEAIASPRAVAPPPIAIAGDNAGWARAISGGASGGAVGGAIGGYYINGTTPSDNRSLSDALPPPR
jgi:hypothetical protein